MRIVDATARLVARAGGALRGVRDRARGVWPQYREPASARRARRARANASRADAASRTKRRAVETERDRRHRLARGRRPYRRAAGHRRRRPALALPHRGRHRERRPRLSADRADLQSRARAGRTTTSRPNSTPRAARSRWCRCPASARAWSAWSSPRRPSGSPRWMTPALNGEIERRSHSILGKIAVEPGRGVFPLAVETARSFGEPHRARRRGRACHSADRRAGPQSRSARRRHHRRTRGGGAPRRRRCRRGRTARALRALRRADVNSRTLRRRPAQPHAPSGFPAGAGRARPRALSASTGSARCAAP